MPYQLFDRVKIKGKDVIGDIVDIYTGEDEQPIYTVQSQRQGYVNDPDAYNGDYPLYDVREDQLTRL